MPPRRRPIRFLRSTAKTMLVTEFRPFVTLGFFGLLGCGALVPGSETETSTEPVGSTSSSTAGTVTSPTGGDVASTTDPASSSGSSPLSTSGTTSSDSGSEGPDTGISTGFITDPDGGGCGGFSPGVMAHCSLCSYFDEDCPPGEACKPTDNANAGTWTTPICHPQSDDATGQPGSPCTVEDGPFSGVDTCASSMCWDVDVDTLEGTCVAFCSDLVPCTNPDDTCFNGNNGFVPICLPRCSPLLQDCPAGQGCYPGTGSDFVCIREGDPLYVDPDTIHPSCPPSSFMGTPQTPGACADEEPCCSSFCDLDAPACADGSVCQPYDPKLEGSDPNADLGYCALPKG